MTWTPIDYTPVDSRPEVSRSLFGHPVVDNLNDLNTRVISNTTIISDATGTTGSGNAALSSRLGTGVTTASTATAQLAAKAPTSRLITAGTGLTGGGDLSADRTLTVAYGTTSTTAAVGNDSRFTTLANQTALLQSYGRWFSTDVSTHGTAASPMLPWTAIGTPLSGVTVNNSTGAWTFANAGVFEISVGWHCTYSLTLNTGFNTNIFVSDGTAAGGSITKVLMQQQGYQVQYVSGTLEMSGTLSSGPIALTAGTVLYFHLGAAQNVVPTGSDGLGRNFFAVRQIA
jgi:hypothetical protein